MTAPQLAPTEGAALVELLEDARDVIALLVEELLTFKAAGSPHKALRSAYSRRGVCSVYRGTCSPLCTAWAEAIDMGAGWIDVYDARRCVSREGGEP